MTLLKSANDKNGVQKNFIYKIIYLGKSSYTQGTKSDLCI